MPGYINTARHAITLGNGRPVAPGEFFEADRDETLVALVADGTLLDVDAQPQPAAEPAQTVATSTVAGSTSIPSDGVIGDHTVAQSDPTPEQAAAQRKFEEDRDAAAAGKSTTRRRSGAKGGGS